MKKLVESPNVLQDGNSSIGRVAWIIKKYPARVLGVCWLLTLSVPSVRDHVEQTWQQAINFLDEQWRQALHPGYRWNGKYNYDDVIYYDDAVKKWYILPTK
jgi:hypothetical protein